MIGLIQRVSEAEVIVNNEPVSKIGQGILLLLGIAHDDGPKDIAFIAKKAVNLRIFTDEKGNLNRSILEVGGEILVVSQFTLLGDTRKGRRPSFSSAAGPEEAESLYRSFIEEIKSYNIPIKEGKFREMMEVKLTNTGPVTLIINSKEKRWN